eukprot:TRINITY_DN26678_c0_g2_i1.p1 TRINITY_DN26678_c0_g2~~TRINITY_DN26678_c0_g2_i1.p1  ORF type:complete len:158 (-),score=16.72 TRINITY_DN26678_c0_g2_i1:230-703(-)
MQGGERVRACQHTRQHHVVADFVEHNGQLLSRLTRMTLSSGFSLSKHVLSVWIFHTTCYVEATSSILICIVLLRWESPLSTVFSEMSRLRWNNVGASRAALCKQHLVAAVFLPLFPRVPSSRVFLLVERSCCVQARCFVDGDASVTVHMCTMAVWIA